MSTGYESLEYRFLNRQNMKECWICSREDHRQGVEILRTIFDFLRINNLAAVSLRLFGSRDSISKALLFLDTEMKDIACPPLSITPDELPDKSSLQVQVHAASNIRTTSVFYENALVGKGFEDDNASYYMLRILPDNSNVSPHNQTRDVFEKANAVLAHYGGGFSNTIRTWLFADDILSWYGQLNKSRDQFFERQNIYQQLIPASTGIGAANFDGKHLAAQVLAVRPKKDKLKIYSADSPLQCPALDYKSSFSRAVKLESPDHSRLYISGTAGIDKSGKTAFVGDIAGQLDLTMRVVDAILSHAGMSWSNVVTSLVYFKYGQDFHFFDEYCSRRGIYLPHIKMQADVCREELLFEIELDAVGCR